ncbi:MAG: preprotein translocase subunit SecA [Chlamydia sp.]
MFSLLKRLFGTAQDRTIRKYRKIVREIVEHEETLKNLPDEALIAKTAEMRDRLKNSESIEALIVEAYATVKSACRRLIGTEIHVSGYDQKWDMVPYDVQLIGALALHYGSVAEMQTGEGKTLTAAMPLYLNALTGKPVHIVTVNDYLAKRDCEWVGSIFRKLGLTTGVLQQSMSHDERKKIYSCDIVYGTASEFGFDYLRDNSMASRKEEQVQRGHYYSLIDEVDSILIDEARTPLIISGPSNISKHLYSDLKKGVFLLVDKQKSFCQELALQAKKVLEKVASTEDAIQLTQDQYDACHSLWLLGKGMPRSKIGKRLREHPDIRAAIDTWDLHYYKEQNKELRKEALSKLYIVVDEKSHEYELSELGISYWAEIGGKEDDFVMLDLGDELLYIDTDSSLDSEEKEKRKESVQRDDAMRKERSHNLRQLLRAHLLMERDVDYIIQDNKIVIIDEHTGRAQPGRRFADGLHQAIEAKENLEIQGETQTYATITLQNYFRLYEKLAGMSGTAITEAHELKEIYKLNVLQIPTYRPCQRIDYDDELYMTEREKYNAILHEIKTIHEMNRPILIGTESIEVSEKLSRILNLNRMNHVVLNAKNHSNEAEIIAQAGQKGVITLATNMAGRGTDIKLSPEVVKLGGLHVIGSTRHQSRRIDRQLRGRSGRLGDPGSSKFFISMEDSLMRLFASPLLTKLFQRLRPPEGQPLVAPSTTRAIEMAQKRIETRNYTMRKHTLEYDNVMNLQRQEVYSFRNELLHTQSPIGVFRDVLEQLITKAIPSFFESEINEESEKALRQWLGEVFAISISESEMEQLGRTKEVYSAIFQKLSDAFNQKLEFERVAMQQVAEQFGFDPDTFLEQISRSIMIQTVDKLWQGHLLEMDHLRSDVNLRAVGQKDPLMEFKHESFRLFDIFTQRMREEIAKAIYRMRFIHQDVSSGVIEFPIMHENSEETLLLQDDVKS